VHLNRLFREKGWLSIKDELGRETLDLGGSKVFAIADHQVAHIYFNDHSIADEVVKLLQSTPGVGQVLGKQEKYFAGLDHPRSGDLVAVSDFRSWFTYYYWNDDNLAPDFARCVDIHRKPGYDPVELFVDPAFKWPKGAVGWRLAKRKLGFRALLDVIPLDAGLVKGSHGRLTDQAEDGPVIIASDADLLPHGPVAATAVKEIMLDHVFGRPA
jgi:hypothetical protein